MLSQSPRLVASTSSAWAAFSTLTVLTALSVFPAHLSYGAGTCINASLPVSTDQSQWDDVKGIVADVSLNPVIEKVQTLDTGQGKTNNDVYSLTIDANGSSAAQIMDVVRGDLGDLVFSGSSYSDFKPYDAASKALWNSKDPKGAVMSFTLKQITSIMPLERGDVVVSCISPTDWVFSTVTTPDHGLHPVSGNRAFGVVDNGDGTLTIFVKAVDRVVDGGIFTVLLTDNLRESIFEQGHQVWLNLLENLEDKFAANNPRDKFIFSVRR